MLILILFSLLTGSATKGTLNYKECLALDFGPEACWDSEQLHKAGRFSCEKQGKKLVGLSDCE